MKSTNNSFKKILFIISGFTIKERIVFIFSTIILIVGLVSGAVAISNHYSVLVPQSGGTYREGIVGSPRFINPVLENSDADHDLTSLVYSGLVRIDEDGSIIHDLASAWAISDDQKTYTVTLKPKMRFHDGKPLTAKDVVFTITKIQDPTLKSPSHVAWEGVTVTAPDEQTVVFALEKPYAGFLSQLSVGILPEHIWKEIPVNSWQMSQYNTEPIGSGPFKIAKVTRSRVGVPEEFTLQAFKNFALGRPFISTFVIVCLPNKSDAYDAFANGSVDGLSGVDSMDVTATKGKNDVVVTKPLPRVFGMFFNSTRNKIFADPSVIRALNLGVNKQELITAIFKGYANPLAGPLPQSTDTSDTDYATRKALAEKILDTAGWKMNAETNIREKVTTSGKTKTSQMLSFSLATANTAELQKSAQLIAEQLATLGVNVEVKVFEIGTLNEQVIRARDFEGLLFGEVIRHDTDLFAFWHSSQKSDPGLNITGYTNKRVDGLLESALKEPDRTKRFELYTTMNQELAKDAPVVFLYTPDFISIVDPTIQNVITPPISGLDDRFSLVYRWYIRTDHVWRIFTH